MEQIVDLHVHSHFSRATSRECTLESLYKWGKIKGLTVIGTGDFTHPEWFRAMRTKLEPAEAGFFRLKPELATKIDHELAPSVRTAEFRFVPSVEIATIYKRGERLRKLHQLVVLPGFSSVREMSSRLERMGNLTADGRPILGLDAQELLRICLETDPQALYIPAHIWTPWFSVFGSKSGFDSLEEAYGDLTGEVRAFETGLSSDPSMNLRVSNLDGLTVMSNSDAHSPQKLGREATVMSMGLSYEELAGAIKTNDERIRGTIEFFPEEGKYHYDGHRGCGVRWSPEETRVHGGICSRCGRAVVVGVRHRVGELASPDRLEGYKSELSKQVEYIIPLPEVLAELRGIKGITGKAIQEEYDRLVRQLGSEFAILRSVPVERIREVSPGLAHAVERMRRGEVYLEPGYDGVFGVVRVFRDAAERTETMRQLCLL